MWGAVIGLIKEGVGGWFDHKKEKVKAKREKELKVIQGDQEWEAQQAEGSKESWKDEFWTILIGYVVVSCFIPGQVEHVKEGFIALSEMPDYFKLCLLVAVGASFGVKIWKMTPWSK